MDKEERKSIITWLEEHKKGWIEEDGRIKEICSVDDINELYQSLKSGKQPEG